MHLLPRFKLVWRTFALFVHFFGYMIPIYGYIVYVLPRYDDITAEFATYGVPIFVTEMLLTTVFCSIVVPVGMYVMSLLSMGYYGIFTHNMRKSSKCKNKMMICAFDVQRPEFSRTTYEWTKWSQYILSFTLRSGLTRVLVLKNSPIGLTLGWLKDHLYLHFHFFYRLSVGFMVNKIATAPNRGAD